MSTILNLSSPCYIENDTRYVFLDGQYCKTIQQCYSSLRAQLSLPGYFGNNLDALEEVLNDLDWITERVIKIIILNSKELLAEDISKKNAFLDILNTSENKRLQIIYLGEEKQPGQI